MVSGLYLFALSEPMKVLLHFMDNLKNLQNGKNVATAS
jgi:hypothetical protein